MFAYLLQYPKALLLSLALHIGLIAGVFALIGSGKGGSANPGILPDATIYYVSVSADFGDGESKLEQGKKIAPLVLESELAPEVEEKEKIDSAEVSSVVKKSAEKANTSLAKLPVKQKSQAISPALQIQSFEGSGIRGASLSSLTNPQDATDDGLGFGFVDAKVTLAPKPFFPMSARRSGFEGRVELKVQVSELGLVSKVEIIKSSGRGDCDKSAQDTIMERWRFSPARKNGQAVSSVERVVVSYQLR